MSKNLETINILFAVLDAIICNFCALAFVWGANRFDKWWLCLFVIVPLALFQRHTLIIDADIEAAEKGEQSDEPSR